MKEIIEETLRKLCSNSRAVINSENGREYIADALLKVFKDNHILFYINKETKESMKNMVEARKEILK